MSKTLMHLALLGLILLPQVPSAQAGEQTSVEVGGVFVSGLRFRSDTDFDPSPRLYDREGQTAGQVLTILRPDLTIDASEQLRVFLQTELGWNAWSLNNPDQGNPTQSDYMIFKMRELWARWDFWGDNYLTAGYQHLKDPSRLFMDHWLGAFTLSLGGGMSTQQIMVGQLPDRTWEGITFEENNFLHDSYFVGLVNELNLEDGLFFDAAGYGVGDYRVVEKPLYLSTIIVGLRYESEDLKIWGHGLSQVGAWIGSAAEGGDQMILGWAAQAGFRQNMGPLHWSANVLALSPDDDHDGNGTIGSFFSSAKNNSSTLMMTEDEFQDRYDNLDELVSSTWGSFFVNRAGLLLADVSVGGYVNRAWHPILIAGGAWNLNSTNAGGNSYLGMEADLVNEFPLGPGASLMVIGQMLLPGQAASVFVNEIDMTATDPVFGVQAGFFARF